MTDIWDCYSAIERHTEWLRKETHPVWWMSETEMRLGVVHWINEQINEVRRKEQAVRRCQRQHIPLLNKKSAASKNSCGYWLRSPSSLAPLWCDSQHSTSCNVTAGDDGMLQTCPLLFTWFWECWNCLCFIQCLEQHGRFTLNVSIYRTETRSTVQTGYCKCAKLGNNNIFGGLLHRTHNTGQDYYCQQSLHLNSHVLPFPTLSYHIHRGNIISDSTVPM